MEPVQDTRKRFLKACGANGVNHLSTECFYHGFGGDADGVRRMLAEASTAERRELVANQDRPEVSALGVAIASGNRDVVEALDDAAERARADGAENFTEFNPLFVGPGGDGTAVCLGAVDIRGMEDWVTPTLKALAGFAVIECVGWASDLLAVVASVAFAIYFAREAALRVIDDPRQRIPLEFRGVDIKDNFTYLWPRAVQNRWVLTCLPWLEHGFTPCQAAVAYGRPEILKHLIRRGCTVVPARNPCTASDWTVPTLLDVAKALHKQAIDADLPPEVVRRYYRCARFCAVVGRPKTTCFGTGASREDATGDPRQVTRLWWVTAPLRNSDTAWLVGARHSLLFVQVGEPDSGQPVYVVEKAFDKRPTSAHHPDALPDNAQSNPLGVRVSPVKDFGNYTHAGGSNYHIQPDYLELFGFRVHATIGPDGVMPGTTMVSIIRAAEATGPYDLYRSNCHHAVHAVLMAHLRDEARLVCPGVPNAWITAAAESLGLTSTYVTGTDRAPIKWHMGPVEFGMSKVSIRGLYDELHTRPDLKRNCAADDHNEARRCVELANWIYAPPVQPPILQRPPACMACPDNLVIEELFLQADGHTQQWAILTDPFDDKLVYIVFCGTASLLDVFIDLGASARTLEDCGIGVHSAMWNALHPHGKPSAEHVPFIVADWLRLNRAGKPTTLVLCGHSLGGAYATLTALALFRKSLMCPDSVSLKVITFGSPQVLARPLENHDLWRALADVSTHYVNAFDGAPRVNFDKKWPGFVADCFEKSLFGISFRMKDSESYIGAYSIRRCYTRRSRQLLKQVFEDFQAAIDRVAIYEPVGTMYFVRADVDYAEKHAGGSAGASELLRRIPRKKGMFVFNQHFLEHGYVDAVKALCVHGDVEQ